MSISQVRAGGSLVKISLTVLASEGGIPSNNKVNCRPGKISCLWEKASNWVNHNIASSEFGGNEMKLMVLIFLLFFWYVSVRVRVRVCVCVCVKFFFRKEVKQIDTDLYYKQKGKKESWKWKKNKLMQIRQNFSLFDVVIVVVARLLAKCFTLCRSNFLSPIGGGKKGNMTLPGSGDSFFLSR